MIMTNYNVLKLAQTWILFLELKNGMLWLFVLLKYYKRTNKSDIVFQWQMPWNGQILWCHGSSMLASLSSVVNMRTSKHYYYQTTTTPTHTQNASLLYWEDYRWLWGALPFHINAFVPSLLLYKVMQFTEAVCTLNIFPQKFSLLSPPPTCIPTFEMLVAPLLTPPGQRML